MVLHYVAQILSQVVPLLEHPSESFLASLEEDLVKLVMKHGQMVRTSPCGVGGCTVSIYRLSRAVSTVSGLW